MAVDAQFSSSVVQGSSPLTVTFTDQSTGSPDSWLWEFGDGESSTEQNPTHVFTGSTGESWTVTLTAWVFNGTFTRTVGSPSSSDRFYQFAGFSPGDSYATVAANFQILLDLFGYIAPQGTNGPVHKAEHRSSDNTYRIQGRYSNLTVDVSGLASSDVVELQYHFSSSYHGHESGFQSDFGTINTNNQGSWRHLSMLSAGTDYGATPFQIQGHLNPPVLSQPDTDERNGFTAVFRTIEYYSSDSDSITKVNTITIGFDAYLVDVDFVGTPLIGTSPLVVQFTDLSTTNTVISEWDFGDGNTATFAGTTHPANTYTTDACSIDIL